MTAHLVRRGAYVVAVALVATGVATVPALAATAGTATLTANDGGAFDGLGQSTAISSDGNVAVAGSPGHGANGAAYIFTNNGQGFSQSAELTPPSTDSGDDFGASAAISGDGQTVVVGADDANSNDGAAFVFTDQSGTWTQLAELTDPGASGLGTSVSISADASTIVVGAPFSNGQAGAAFVFTKSGSTYTEAQELTGPALTTAITRVAPNARKPAPAPTSVDLLGWDVAASSDGSTIVLGAPVANNQAGFADVFTKSGTTWTQTAHLVGNNTAASDNFGFTVAVSGSGATVAIGSPSSNAGDGSAYVFTQAGGTFTQASQVLPPAGTSGAAAGLSVGMSSDGSVIAIGAGHLNQDAGGVFVATETNGTFAVTATNTEPNPVSDDDLGFTNTSTAVAGNGSAIISGARGFNGGLGAAFVFPLS
jgi:FG-GAP repeat